MRRSKTLLAGAAAAAALLVSGCSAGQIAETAGKVASVPGASADITTDDGILSVRNAVVVYDGTEGYKAGADAPLDVRIFNGTQRDVTVTVSVNSEDAGSVSLSGGEEEEETPSQSPSESASPSASASPSGSASPSASATPSASPSPTAKPARPASIEIAAGEFVVLTEAAGEYLRVIDLAQPLTPGTSVRIIFDFGDGRTKELAVPVGIPLSPAARESAEVSEEH